MAEWAAGGGGIRVRAAVGREGAPQPGGAAARPLRRAGAVAVRPRGHGARHAVRVERGPMVGRAARRLRVGPRRARHEEPGGGGAGGRAHAGGGGLAARVRRPPARVRGRRGGGLAPRRQVALREPPGQGALRLQRQRGRRRGVRVRRPPLLLGLRGGEGRVPLHALHERARGARLDPAHRRQRPAQARPAAHAARGGGDAARAEPGARGVPARARAC